MLWFLLAAAVALGSVVVLALVALQSWGNVKGLKAAVGRAGDAVAGVQGELEAGLSEMSARAPGAPTGRDPAPQSADGAELARRVQARRH